MLLDNIQLGDWRNDWRKAPNLISFGRIALIVVPCLFVGWGIHDRIWWWWAILAFAGVAATDAIDGFVARRSGLTSELGKFLDPVADKLLVVAVLITIDVAYSVTTSWGGWLWLVTVFIILRELIVTFVLKSRVRGHIQAAVMSGKIKMWAQCAMIVSLLIPLDGWWFWVQLVMVAFAVIMTAISWIDYIIRFFMKLPTPPEDESTL